MGLKKYFEFKEADLEPVKSFHLKDELNPDVWEDSNIKSEVREKLLQIGEDFYGSTDLQAEVMDIVLCGSLCNYNWSEEYSDYDLHIIIDYTDINEDAKLVEKVCDLSKKLWNEQHEIKVKGYEVEVAIQDNKALKTAIKNGRMGGVYSLLNNKWVKKAEKIDFEPDEELIREKGKSIMMEVDDLMEKPNEEYPKVKERIKKVWDKIKTLRERSLSEEGEFGVGNLVFKLLRRNNYLGKIMDLKRNAYDKQFESTDEGVLELMYLLDDLSSKLNDMSSDGWWMELTYEYDETQDFLEVNYNSHGYSEGFTDDLIIYYKEDPIRVERDNVGNTVYGDYTNQRTEYFNSFEELIKDIKEEFGL